jgi:hypothetical protein
MPPLQHSVTPEDKSAKTQAPQVAQPTAMPSAMPPIQREMDISRLQPNQVLSLQRSIGNRAVQKMVTSSRNAPVIQPKLELGPVGDRYEQEADRVAAQVMKMPATPPPTAQRESESDVIQRDLFEEDEESQG